MYNPIVQHDLMMGLQMYHFHDNFDSIDYFDWDLSMNYLETNEKLLKKNHSYSLSSVSCYRQPSLGTGEFWFFFSFSWFSKTYPFALELSYLGTASHKHTKNPSMPINAQSFTISLFILLMLLNQLFQEVFTFIFEKFHKSQTKKLNATEIFCLTKIHFQ